MREERLEFLSNIDIYGPLFPESRCFPLCEWKFSLLISYSPQQITEALGLSRNSAIPPPKKSPRTGFHVKVEFESVEAVGVGSFLGGKQRELMNSQTHAAGRGSRGPQKLSE